MPHPTTPSGGQEATGLTNSGEGLKRQATMAEFKAIERPFTATPLSSSLKSPFSSVKTDARFSADAVPTPPQSPTRSSLWEPPSHRANPETPSPPATPGSQGYSKTPATAGRQMKAGGDSWKGLTERLTEELWAGGYDKSLDNGTRDLGNEKKVKEKNNPIAN